MILADYHLHTNFCDGKDTPRQMVEEAIKKGVKEIGISVHSYTSFDGTYCIKKDRIEEYKAELDALKREYAHKIKVLIGVEIDYYSDMDISGFDYSVGSVHYLKVGDKYLSIDESEQTFKDIAERYFGGDYYALAREYFSLVADIVEKVKPNIIGHFDLLTKFNEGGKLFDENDPRYVESYKKAVDRLVLGGIPFEVNLGAIVRGLRTQPYPSRNILEYIKEKGGKVILSSDSHTKENICYNFEFWHKKLEEMGFQPIKINL